MQAQNMDLHPRPQVAVLFDNLQRIAPAVKKAGRELELSC
jgi:hypothetical protein